MDTKQLLGNLATRLEIEPATASRLLEGFTEVIAEECRNLNKVAIPGFGSFTGEKRDETVVRGLTTGRRLLLPPAIEVHFTAGGRLKNGLGEGHEL